MPAGALAALMQGEHLLGLRPPSQVRVLAPSEKLDAQSDWIIGFKAFSDGASLHGGHWERHPLGDEVLCLLEGRVRVILRAAGAGEGDEGGAGCATPLEPGQMLVVPRGSWHRLEVLAPGRLLFITPARGSEHERCGDALGSAD